MPEIQAIETTYNGVLFRSRTEARWAFYFDHFGIVWRYEVEGFQLPSGWYVPDFWLPQVNLWAEVKPGQFSDLEVRKCIDLEGMTGRECLLLDGAPEAKEYATTQIIRAGDWDWNRKTGDTCGYSIDDQYLDEHRFFGFGGADWPEIKQAVEKASAKRFW